MSDPLQWVKSALEGLINRSLVASRFTQDSPVLPEVWLDFGTTTDRLDLLLTPHWNSSATELAAALYQQLSDPHSSSALSNTKIAYTQSVVAASLTLDELLWRVLPLTRWSQRYLLRWHESKGATLPPPNPPTLLSVAGNQVMRAHLRKALLGGLEGQHHPTIGPVDPTSKKAAGPAWDINLLTGLVRDKKDVSGVYITSDLLWFVQLSATLRLLDRAALRNVKSAHEAVLFVNAVTNNAEALVDNFLEGLKNWCSPPESVAPLWSVNRNRRGAVAMVRSTATVKADAARKVFGITGAGVRWAVIDSGIDAHHLAFRRRVDDSPRDLPKNNWTGATRILATYDFSDAREKLSERAAHALKENAGETGKVRVGKADLPTVDWIEWGKTLQIPHNGEKYKTPDDNHGTHVAGILGAHWRAEDDAEDGLPPDNPPDGKNETRLGICPEIELYDIRVINSKGECDEFSLIAALQFVRALNAAHDHIEIAGVNISLSLLHDVANFACGRTPVCEECERLVASGVVVVTAAGNQGRAQYITSSGKTDEGYRSISITDPGNAPSVITVGSTHRLDPHGYGVSYFSSRGPTGDGRLKPDLVAPGEKVVSTICGNREDAMDGTSMAAPHVSGAAALLLARHPELKGRPAEIKRILCSTTVDLGRERYFQGAGLLDILHALESL
ncbi:MAG: S8 family peptidase [Polyangiaceae bacterium]|nr:S8 family peptidase [Polyangiaceae bacterium]